MPEDPAFFVKQPCMHKVHGFACVLTILNPPPVSALVRPEAVHASALKAVFKLAGVAGRALRASGKVLI